MALFPGIYQFRRLDSRGIIRIRRNVGILRWAYIQNILRRRSVTRNLFRGRPRFYIALEIFGDRCIFTRIVFPEGEFRNGAVLSRIARRDSRDALSRLGAIISPAR